MARVLAGITMSVDGYIAGPGGGPGKGLLPIDADLRKAIAKEAGEAVIVPLQERIE